MLFCVNMAFAEKVELAVLGPGSIRCRDFEQKLEAFGKVHELLEKARKDATVPGNFDDEQKNNLEKVRQEMTFLSDAVSELLPSGFDAYAKGVLQMATYPFAKRKNYRDLMRSLSTYSFASQFKELCEQENTDDVQFYIFVRGLAADVVQKLNDAPEIAN
ncbi:MAG TPA: hypothetical protein VM901_02050 [Bdellovibrionota bacterium]|jgi:hypothetical protein|nr:hypothetical protein [Bdellovibrionota bacterium]